MRAIGYSSATAWVFPAIIDTAVAVSTLMLVALGDKPARRTRTVTMSANTQTPAMQTVGATCDAECKNQGHTGCTDQCAGTDGTSRAGTDLCIGTTRPGTDSAGLSANRGDAGRCRPCVGADCLRCDYTARRDRDRSAGGNAVTARRSTLPPRHRGSTTGLRSGSWRLPPSVGRDSSWRLPKTHRTHQPGRQSELVEYDLVNVLRRHAFDAPTPV